jgi:hypothetical protein
MYRLPYPGHMLKCQKVEMFAVCYEYMDSAGKQLSLGSEVACFSV